jgi:cytochrome c nitrite reductase small subunit
MKKSSPKIWIIAAVVALFTAGGALATVTFTSSDSFCVSCHAYEKVSWDHGDHPDVGCVSCHTKGMMTDKTKGVRKVILTASGKVNPHNSTLPSYKEALTQNCAGCHMSDEILAARPIYKDRHEEYRKFVADCVGCHEPGHVKKLRGMREVPSRQVKVDS